MQNFSDFDLNSNIYKAISACGYTTPTPVQAKAIPEVLKGRDVVVTAQTGTGKTASFVLPALNFLCEQHEGAAKKKTRILVLTPTRELADQITKAAHLYGKFLKFNIISLVGGVGYHGQIRDLQRGADIIVATPGRLMDHMGQKRVDLSHIDMLVLDEADRMLDMGFIDDVQYIAKLTPAKRQTLLFSATLDNKLMNAVKHLLHEPVRINLSTEKVASPKITQHLYQVGSPHQKMNLLKHLLKDEQIYKAIIFSATKVFADRLADELCEEGFSAAALHGDLRQNVRNRTLDKLRQGKIQFLVATDVAARGIDVRDITHVFNYDLPKFSEDYVHRIGRTGRAGKTGIAISFAAPNDKRHLQGIERYIGQRIQVISSPFSQAPAATSKKETSHSAEKKSFSSSSKKRYSDKKPFSDKKSFSDRKSFSEKKSFSDRKPFSDKKPFSGKKKSFSDKNPFSHKKEFSKHSFSERGDRPYKKQDENRKRPFTSRSLEKRTESYQPGKPRPRRERPAARTER